MEPPTGKLPKAWREFFATTGREGGRLRAKRLSAQRRKEIAKKAAVTRWKARPRPAKPRP